MSVIDNTKLNTINASNEEEKFLDVESCDKIQPHEIKGIIKNIKTPQEIENDNKFKTFIAQFVGILFVSLFVSPFVICDLVFGYKDDSCVNIYPENMNFMNMKIYLLVSGYLAIGLLSCIIINLYFVVNDNISENIVLVAFLSIILYISQVFFIIWNILGAVIFWSTLNKHNYCSKSINTYLFVSLIIKLFANFCNIMSTNNKKEK